MSQEEAPNQENQTLTQEVSYKEIINEIMQNKDKYPEEAKLILVLHREKKYNLSQDYHIEQGQVIETKIADYTSSNSDYYFNEDIAIIPTSVPVIIREVERNGYEGTQKEYLHVFTGKEWVQLELY